MIVAAIDPGRTIGMCLYDSTAKRVLDACECSKVQDVSDVLRAWYAGHNVEAVGIEWPRVYSSRDKAGVIKHASGNDVADVCAQAGMLWSMIGAHELPATAPEWDCRWLVALTRGKVVRFLASQVGQEVRGDQGVWAALVDLHGGKGVADKRGTKKDPEVGPMGLLSGKPHARAALAVAFAVAGDRSLTPF